MSHAYWFVLAHQVVWITFFITVAWYELRERLLVPQDVLEQEESCDCDSVDDVLWRDPNLSLSSLSEVLESNRTYVGEAFKRNTGMTPTEFVNNLK